MLYYKVPVVNGVTDCSAGSILLCAYPLGNYMVCKFESVANVGSKWVKITAQEFEANCPDFPAIWSPPVQDVIATAATLSSGSIVLTLPVPVDTGTLVKFRAPCACSAVTGGLKIDGITYSIVDAMGNRVANIGVVWNVGAQIAVLIDATEKKAYIQNASAKQYADSLFAKAFAKEAPMILANGVHYGDELPEAGTVGRLFFKKVIS